MERMVAKEHRGRIRDVLQSATLLRVNIVFDALELMGDERNEVYRAVCRLVWNRDSKAKSI